MANFKVVKLQDSTYQVHEIYYEVNGSKLKWDKRPVLPLGTHVEEKSCPVFQGSIADCEAYIRLKEKGYM